MKIVKLISNEAAKSIRSKHTEEEIESGIVCLMKVESAKHQQALWEKLMEEVGEAFADKSDKEIDDVIEVCRALKGENTKFSERWAMVVGRGHYKNEED